MARTFTTGKPWGLTALAALSVAVAVRPIRDVHTATKPPTRSLARRVAGGAVASSRRFTWGRICSQALQLRRPWRYIASAVLGAPGPRRYEVRATGIQVLLRHRSRDIATFDEVFCSAAYKPPQPVIAALHHLGRPPRVLDLGANIGLFSAYAIGRWPGAQITAFEPDPENVALLRSCVALNRARGRVAIVEAAAATTTGTMSFVAGLVSESHRPHPDEHANAVAVRTLDAFEHIACADLVKIDIEGSEWELLGDPRLALGGVQALVLEHHGRHCPTDDPRTTATRLLIAAGYEVHSDAPSVRGVGLLWAWRYPPSSGS